jgi:integrase
MVKRPKAPKTEMSVWTAEQARRFIEHAKDDRLYALWFLLLTTGLRRGEVAALRWSDIDLNERTLSVQRTRVTVDYTVVENEPKTPQSRRRIALDVDTVEALRAHRRQQSSDRKRLGDDWQQTGYVFTDEIGEPMHPQAITDRFQKLASEAGVPVMRLHDLRHTSATLALSAGVHPKVVQERLGHSSIMITMDTYSHVVQGMQEAAAEKLAGLLR